MSITVVIPTHNRSGLLRIAIESALGADEVIVFDNGSDDDTEQVAGSYPVTYVRNPVNSRTPTDAINYGIDHAASEWLMVLADDDWLLPDALERIKSHLSGDIVFSDLYLCDMSGAMHEAWRFHERPTDADGLVEFCRRERMNPIPMIGPFRVEWIRSNNLHFIMWPSTIYAEDCRTFLEWAKHEPDIRYVPGPFYVHRRHDEQGSHNSDERGKFLADMEAYFRGEA